MGPREERQSDSIGVLLDDRLDHLLRGLVQPGVDHLEPAVAQRPGDDLGPPVVPVEPGLGHDHPVGTFHDGPRIRRRRVRAPDRTTRSPILCAREMTNRLDLRAGAAPR